MAAHACLKNEITEEEKYHNLTSWLRYMVQKSTGPWVEACHNTPAPNNRRQLQNIDVWFSCTVQHNLMIISDDCEAIIEDYAEEVIACPTTPQEWQ